MTKINASNPAASNTNCFACGRSFAPGHGDGRFCRANCRDEFNSGQPPFDANRNPGLDVINVRPDKWRVVAGPPGTIGTNPCAVLERPTDMTSGKHGFIIRCANCTRKFDSKGLRCCSPACENKLTGRVKVVASSAPVDAGRRCAVCSKPMFSSRRQTCSARCRQEFHRRSKRTAA